MSETSEAAAQVITAISTGVADQATTEIVQALLCLTTISSTTSGRAKAAAVSKRGTNAKHGSARKIDKLSSTIARRFATELATTGSKALAQARTKQETKTKAVLKTSSGNATPSPCKPVTKSRAQPLPFGDSFYKSTAECTQLALTYLRSSCNEQARPRILEASLALVKHLLSLKLVQLAIAELRGCKHLLNARERLENQEIESAEHLMTLNLGEAADTSILRLAIVYQTLTIRATALASQNAADELAKHITTSEQPPHALVERYVAVSLDNDKAAIYMEIMSSDLLALCPRTSSPADLAASDLGISPLSVFHIQAYALHLKTRWWLLAKHEIDASKALSEQFLRIAKTFSRRAAAQHPAEEIGEAIQTAYRTLFENSLQPLESSQDVKKMMQMVIPADPNLMADIDTSRGQHDGDYTSSSQHDCYSVATMAKAISEYKDQDEIERELTHLALFLEGKLSGEREHYGKLLNELARLIRKQCTTKTVSTTPARLRLVRATLRLISWTEESYPALDSKAQQSIVLSVLRTYSRKQAAAWIDQTILAVVARGDVLDEMAAKAAESDILSILAASPAAILLAEVVDVLMLKLTLTEEVDAVLTTLTTPFFDTCTMLQKGLLLECQLRACLKYATPNKTSTNLRNMCKQILTQLDGLYTSELHPIRRAVVYIQTTIAADRGLVDEADVLNRPHAELNTGHLGQDDTLAAHVPELQASLASCRVWCSAKNNFASAQDALRLWRTAIVGRSGSTMYDLTTSSRLLETLLSFSCAQGWENESLMTSELLLQLHKPGTTQHTAALLAHCELRSHYLLSIGDHSKMLEEVANATDKESNIRRRCYLVLAQAQLRREDFMKSEAMLANASSIVLATPSSSRRDNAQLCASAWVLHSRICMARADLRAATSAARTAVTLVNSIWQALEQGPARGSPSKTDDSEFDTTAELTTKVSKLQLQPGPKEQDKTRQEGGRAFWELLPLACDALLNLAGIYRHAGLFAEARHHITKAVDLTAGVPGSLLSIRVRSELASLLAAAGKLDEAELCLTKIECPDYASDRLVATYVYKAQAQLHTKLEEYDEALSLLDKAIHIAERQAESVVSSNTCNAVTKLPRKSIAATTKISRKPTGRTAATTPKHRIERSSSSTLESLIIEKVNLQAKLGMKSDTSELSALKLTSKLRRAQHMQAMSQLDKKLQMHVVYNALHESTLLWPSAHYQTLNDTTNKQLKASSAIRSTKTKKVVTKADILGTALAQARSHLRPELNADESLSEIHRETRTMVDSSVYALSSRLGDDADACPMDITAWSGLAASTAKQREITTLLLDTHSTDAAMKLSWPRSVERSVAVLPDCSITNDLPQSWTAVELLLNEDCSALIAVRHRKHADPLIIRLPFARQELGSDEEGPFDYQAGRTELKDIIEQSNRICHVGNDSSSRMTSTTWWREREELDRRLEELLLNIEELWFGGFKGVLCPSAKSAVELSTFRNEFEAVLGRHIAAARSAQIPDSLLQLFLDLCHSQQGELDIDSAVLDLWYGVVDSLRFNGLELAYDELDFDSLTIETIDAIQAYHDDATEQESHLILVLDKKLHNFPWESLPYLASTSVSRMPDMTSLCERLIAVQERYTIHHSTVILDPAADMKRTQQTLEPALQDLRTRHPTWTTLSGQKPSERQFEQALQTSDLLMYFGHGAGSQYIRPRTVKKLKSCSKVVWLMGCSSGEILEHDELEPTSVPTAYLLAADGGCMAVVANLWDVTDKDIDRFSIAMGEDWGLWSVGEAQRPVKVRARQPLQTPPGSPKTPKAPKSVRRAGEKCAPPRQKAAEPCSLAKAVSNSRESCYLRYLNGAAPVVYGVPVMLG